MSGGHFDYKQYHINDIADSIQRILDMQGKEKDKYELWLDKQYYKDHPEEKFNYTYPKEVQKELKKGIKLLRQAAVYTQRIDWLISGDDGEDTFLKRLKEDLNKL